jgi:hypothetical protein
VESRLWNYWSTHSIVESLYVVRIVEFLESCGFIGKLITDENRATTHQTERYGGLS